MISISPLISIFIIIYKVPSVHLNQTPKLHPKPRKGETKSQGKTHHYAKPYSSSPPTHSPTPPPNPPQQPPRTPHHYQQDFPLPSQHQVRAQRCDRVSLTQRLCADVCRTGYPRAGRRGLRLWVRVLGRRLVEGEEEGVGRCGNLWVREVRRVWCL